MAFVFAWRYQTSNRNAMRRPGLLGPDRRRGLAGAGADRHRGRRPVWRSTHKLDLPRDRLRCSAARHQVVAQTGSGCSSIPTGHRGGEPDGDPEQAADQPADHLRHGDELVLCAGAGQPDLLAGMHACRYWPCPGKSSAATPVQRRWLLRPVLRGAGLAAVRRLVAKARQRPASSRCRLHQARRKAGSFRSPTIRRSSPSSSIRSSPSTPTPTRRLGPARRRPSQSGDNRCSAN